LTFCRITDKIVYGGIEVYFFTPMPIFYYKGGTVLGEHKTCYKCFKNYDIGLHVCPYCNHNEYSPHNPMYIKAGAKLNNRYIVGILLEYNGEGATYVALDTSTDCKVMIREYMPINLCTRVKDKTTISVNYNNLAKFKAFLAEYTDLNKSLARLRENTNINPILDMFEENNTWYTVFEYINGVKMLDYLKENAGELSWGQIAKLFPPLFTTMGILHNAGIIHRAISPDTVYINNKGELRLFGFSISAVRTANAGLEYELFRGYSAPEQYSADINSRQGSWTDVYGVCALMYRALTGCMPVDSQTRMSNDELCEPSMLNPTIPPSVSRTIMDGMKLKSSERIKNVTELVTRLFEQPVKPAPVPMNQNGNTRTMPSQNNYTPKNNYAPPQNNYVPPQNNYVPPQNNYVPPQNNYVPPQNNYTTPLQPVYPNQTPPPYVQQNASSQQSNSGKEESENTVEKFKVPIIIGILLVSILMIISVIITNMITSTKKANEEAFMKKSSISNSSNSSPEEEQTVTEAVTERFDTIMPDLVGKYYNITEQKYSEYLNFEVIYDYNDDFETDYIFEQNIKAGEQIASGSTVRVKVSKGKETAEIPKYSGLTADEYEEKLKEAGISNYSMIAMPTASSGTPNTVVQLQIGSKLVYPGTVFSNKEGSKLIIYYLPENVEILNGGSSGNSSSSSDNSSSGNSFNYQYATEASTSSSWSNFNWSIDGNSSNNSNNNNNNNNNNNSSNGDNGSSGGDNSNTGGDSGSTGGDNSNTGGDSGSTGGDNGNTGGDSGSTGGDNGNTGGDSGSTGGDSGNAGGDGGNNSGGEVPEIDVSGGGDSGTV